MPAIRNLNLRAKIFLFSVLINILTTGTYSWFAYQGKQSAILAGIDRQLETAALGTSKILGDSYHDRITGPDAVPEEEYLRNLRRLSDYAKSCQVDYLYAFIRVGTNVVFSASSASDEELANGTYSKFHQAYDAGDDLLRQFRERQASINGEFSDNFGEFRSVTLLRTTPGGRDFIVGADRKISFVRQELHNTLLWSVSIGIVMFGAVLVLSYAVVDAIAKPIVALARYTQQLAAKDFASDKAARAIVEDIPRRSGDEVGRLASSFITMEDKLHEYLRNLQTTTAAKERIESEIKIAKDIQMGILPKVFSPFANAPALDLYALIEPAREVGGDLYDFFFLGETKLCFAIGDVSDKGVPASLFMAVTKTLVRTSAGPGIGPEEVLARVNTELCRENETGQFVTMFCGILDLLTGEIVFSDGGHNPPFHILPDGKATMLSKDQGGLAVGILDGVEFTRQRMVLKPGETLYLYTDGVTEAQNEKGEFYGEERLCDILQNHTPSSTSTKDLVQASIQDLRAFVGDAPQADDITVLAIRVLPRT